ncbi:MAG: K(+)-transporting ATPase subunit F [Elusimicrobia bacterium]|nr:K(+)-transporting ATPase subunit F [Elusimicrobiota bacterium]
MNPFHAVALVLTLGLFAYLFLALFKPEQF